MNKINVVLILISLFMTGCGKKVEMSVENQTYIRTSYQSCDNIKQKAESIVEIARQTKTEDSNRIYVYSAGIIFEVEQLKSYIGSVEKQLKEVGSQHLKALQSRDKIIAEKEKYIGGLEKQIEDQASWLWKLMFMSGFGLIASGLAVLFWFKSKTGSVWIFSGIGLIGITWFLSKFIFWISIGCGVVGLLFILWQAYKWYITPSADEVEIKKEPTEPQVEITSKGSLKGSL